MAGIKKRSAGPRPLVTIDDAAIGAAHGQKRTGPEVFHRQIRENRRVVGGKNAVTLSHSAHFLRRRQAPAALGGLGDGFRILTRLNKGQALYLPSTPTVNEALPRSATVNPRFDFRIRHQPVAFVGEGAEIARGQMVLAIGEPGRIGVHARPEHQDGKEDPSRSEYTT